MKPFALSSTFTTLVFGCAYALWVVLEIWYALSSVRRAGQNRDRGTIVITLLTYCVFLPLSWISAMHVPNLTVRGNQWAIFWLGMLVMLFGTVFRFWAIRTLGKYFTPTVVIQKGQQLVTAGPYKYLRHPSYTGVFFTLLGSGIVLGNWLSVLFCVLAFGAILVRINVEEKVLLQHFGAEYENYMKHTDRLIPGIY